MKFNNIESINSLYYNHQNNIDDWLIIEKRKYYAKNYVTKNEFINDIYILRIFSNPINKDYITKSFSFFLKYTKIIDNMLKI